jgi:hypothetical protein
MDESGAPVRLDFIGSAWGLAGWCVLLLASALLVIPLAWVSAAACRWMCRNITFSDGTVAEFRGTGSEMVVWYTLMVLALAGAAAGFRGLDPGGQIVLILFAFAFLMGIKWMALKWFVYNIHLSSGPPLTFTGSYVGLLGWYLVLVISIGTVIGWIWVLPPMCRWLVSKVKGEGVAVEFHGSAVWSPRRLVQAIILRRGVDTSAWQLKDVSKRKQSSPPPRQGLFPTG